MKTPLIASLLAVALVGYGGLSPAAEQAKEEAGKQETVYGSQLMTEQERAEHRNRMRAANTQEERDRIRAEHHEAMQKRAKERGVTLPEEPPARPGRGPGAGPGGGNLPGAGY